VIKSLLFHKTVKSGRLLFVGLVIDFGQRTLSVSLTGSFHVTSLALFVGLRYILRSSSFTEY
jgi:hypothetical protein